MYAFLCRAFAYPGPAHLEALRDDILPALAGFELDDATTVAVSQVVEAIGAPLEALRAAHTALFTLTVSADCPDYETAYASDDIFQQTQAMADVGGFYRAHGLDVGGIEQERPDHITAELEFMSFLALKEAYAIDRLGEAELEAIREDQVLFLRDHLGVWGPEFGRRVEAQTSTEPTFYAAVGKALSGWLREECEAFEVTPADRSLVAHVEWPEADDGVCGSEGECPLIGLDQIRMAR